MQRTIYDFDVVSGPVEPRQPPKPAPKPQTGKNPADKPVQDGK